MVDSIALLHFCADTDSSAARKRKKLQSTPVLYNTSIKNHFYKMKRDIGMADYEKLVKQEFHTPSLYLCFFYNWDAAEQSGFMEDSYIKKQRYRDGVWNSCFTSFS